MLRYVRLIAVFASSLAVTQVAAEEVENAPDCGLYTYKAKIVRVIDGDTIVADFDLGFRTWLHGEQA